MLWGQTTLDQIECPSRGFRYNRRQVQSTRIRISQLTSLFERLVSQLGAMSDVMDVLPGQMVTEFHCLYLDSSLAYGHNMGRSIYRQKQCSSEEEYVLGRQYVD